MIAKLGRPGAVTATAHKLARLIYSMLKNGTKYTEVCIEKYEADYQQRVLKNLKKRANTLGFELIKLVETEEVNSSAVLVT